VSKKESEIDLNSEVIRISGLALRTIHDEIGKLEMRPRDNQLTQMRVINCMADHVFRISLSLQEKAIKETQSNNQQTETEKYN
jgi:hypothetical protein